MPKKTTPAQRFAQIFALFTNGATPGERAAAERKMDAWLKRNGKTRADISSILVQAAADDAASSQPPPPPSDPRDVDPSQPIGGTGIGGTNVTVLDLIGAMLGDYLALQPHQYVAIAPWIASRPEKTDNITAAAIYDTIDRERCTLLIDEADNLEVSAKGALRAVLNSGYRKGGSVRRGTGRQRRKYQTFAPIALAAIGVLTLPLMSRSIVVHMTRHDGSRLLRRFDLGDTRDLDLAYQHVRAWAQNVVLNLDPDMPVELRDRTADNWRPLISIADACGPAWGRLAREAAVAFAKSYREEDVVVILLGDAREIFNTRRVDRLTSKALVDALNAMDDAGWSEYRGPHDDQQPRKLTQAALASLLRPLGIRPRSIWSSPRGPGDSSAKGYYRADFEKAWAAYCDESGTPAQANKIIPLLRPRSGTGGA